MKQEASKREKIMKIRTTFNGDITNREKSKKASLFFEKISNLVNFQPDLQRNS